MAKNCHRLRLIRKGRERYFSIAVKLRKTLLNYRASLPLFKGDLRGMFSFVRLGGYAIRRQCNRQPKIIKSCTVGNPDSTK